MPSPDGLTITTIHMKYVEPNSAGTPLSGTVTFTPNPAVITFPTQNVIVAGTETATLDGTGQATIDLIATDQTGEIPTGWTYSVQEKINGQTPRSYIIALPYNAGVTVELADITPTSAAPTYLPVTGPQGPPGVITTVNLKTGASITLNSADIGSVALTAVGVANGVASLDAGTKIPVAQIPSLSGTYLLASLLGAANGVAGLNASSVVPSAQLSLASATPTAIATAGAVGTATNLAREDHTHAGVNLTSAQTVAGVKTWTANQFVTGAQLGVGISSGLQGRTHLRSVVDEIVLQVDQVTVTGNNPLIGTVGFDANIQAFATKVTGDTVNRLVIQTSGIVGWGSGAGARDVTLYRSASGNLNSNQFNADAAAPTAVSHLTRKDYVDTADALAVHLAGAEAITGVKTFSAIPVFTPGITVNGTLTLAASMNMSAGALLISRGAATNPTYRTQVTADTQDRMVIDATGKILWGTGAAAGDANLYRSGIGAIKTDTALVVGTDLKLVNGTTIFRDQLSTSVTVANTVTETVIATLTIPANDAVVGAIYRITVFGNASVTGTPNFSLNGRIGGVAGTLAASTGPSPAGSGATNQSWSVDFDLVCLTTGASATWAPRFITTTNLTSASAQTGGVLLQTTGTIPTADSTASQAMVVTWTWGTASASNTTTARAICRRLA